MIGLDVSIHSDSAAPRSDVCKAGVLEIGAAKMGTAVSEVVTIPVAVLVIGRT